MSVGKQVSKGIAWLSLFKIVSQSISWLTTILIARLLTSKDYGLMEMATVFTGYIDFFVEFGISSAIINRKDLSKNLLSSIFWFLVFWGMLLASSTLLIGPLTAWYFNIPELSKITSAVGILFIISSLSILPRSLLHRNLDFKKIGVIDVISILTACLGMYILAKNGAGVWTLLGGTIIKEFIRVCLLYTLVKINISLHFSFNEIKPILSFGIPIVVSNTIFYLYNKADRFFGGKMLGDFQLGFYAIALQLAAMPVEKILSIFQSALFPGLSALQNEKEKFNSLFLNFLRVIYSVILPIFIGGFLTADFIIPIFLGEKWLPSVLSFKLLLIGQIFVSLCSPLHIVHTSMGKPKIPFYANIILSPILILAFYLSSKLNDQSLLALPWITVYPIFVICYLIFTLKKLDISLLDYINTIKHSIFATALMSIWILLASQFMQNLNNLIQLSIIIFSSIFLYSFYMYTFQRELILELKRLVRE